MASPTRVKFGSRRDIWLVVVLGGAAAIEIGVVVWLAMSPGPAGGTGRWLLVLGLLASAGLILWTLFGTRYLVDDHLLIAHCGPFRWRVPLTNIRRLSRVFSLASAPALSAHRVLVEIRGQSPLEISPADPEGMARAVGLPLE